MFTSAETDINCRRRLTERLIGDTVGDFTVLVWHMQPRKLSFGWAKTELVYRWSYSLPVQLSPLNNNLRARAVLWTFRDSADYLTVKNTKPHGQTARARCYERNSIRFNNDVTHTPLAIILATSSVTFSQYGNHRIPHPLDLPLTPPRVFPIFHTVNRENVPTRERRRGSLSRHCTYRETARLLTSPNDDIIAPSSRKVFFLFPCSFKGKWN